jgi:cellulose synthase/poly-beta-1,6-N-acetylglucosamine synthase-like glycosyltransferase
VTAPELTSLVLDGVLAVLGGLLLLRWAALAVLSTADWAIRQRHPLPGAPPSGVAWPPVAVVIPAYNESAVLEAAVRSALEGDYPSLRVVVVDDGSTDDTWAIAERLAADPRVVAVAQRPNQGKPAALDAGIAAVDAELIVTVDADTVLARDAVRRLVAPFLHDDRLGAVAGNVKVGNRTTVLAVFQSLEYVTGLNLGRRAQHRLRCITTVPGAAGAWRRAAIEAVGGVPGDTRIEDTDLTIAVQKAGWRVAYQPDAVAYTEAPTTWAGLVAQRTRWVGGYLQVSWKHRGVLFRHGALGWLGMPDLIYRNVVAIVLIPLVFPALWRLVVNFSAVAALDLVIGIVALDFIGTSLAYVEDRERARELLWAPIRRLVWPWFLLFIVARVVVVALRQGALPWAQVARTGTLARASRDVAGPRVIRRG